MRILALLALTLIVTAAPVVVALPTHETTYSYYGFDYGQTDGNYCICKIGPCPHGGFLMGQKTYACDGGVYTWGVTSGNCFVQVEEETSSCSQMP